MKMRFARRMLTKGVILTSLTAPAAACVVVVGDHPGDHDPRVIEYDRDGMHSDGIRDDGSELAGRVADRLRDQRRFEKASVKVYNDNGRITLTGHVDSMTEYRELVEFVRNIDGVESVTGRMAVDVE